MNLSEEKKIDRRGYMKYAAAGIVVVAGAGAGVYYATRPTTPPTTTAQKDTLIVGTTDSIETSLVESEKVRVRNLGTMKMYEKTSKTKKSS